MAISMVRCYDNRHHAISAKLLVLLGVSIVQFRCKVYPSFLV
jgi:hypothetical protein